MPALSKIAKEGVESLTDFLSSFAKKQKAAGFGDKTYYHGSVRPDIEKFDPKSPPSIVDDPNQSASRGVTYFTTDPKYADEILAYQSVGGKYDTGSTVYPVKLKGENWIFDFDDKHAVDELVDSFGKYWDRQFGDSTEALIRKGDWSTLEIPEIQDALKDAGYTGYKTNEPGTVGLFYPDQGDVRSINAKFDPAKAKSGNILASVPAAAAVGLSGYGALDALGEENGQSSN